VNAATEFQEAKNYVPNVDSTEFWNLDSSALRPIQTAADHSELPPRAWGYASERTSSNLNK